MITLRPFDSASSTRFFIVLPLLCLLLSGCHTPGDNYASHRNWASWTGLVPLQHSQRNSAWAMDANAQIYVVAPASGIHNPELEAEMAGVFKRYFPRTQQSQYRESLIQSFVSARELGMDFVVYPTVRTYADQQHIAAFVRRDITFKDLARGQAQIDLLIFASQGEELVDHLKLNTRGSFFTTDSRALIWPPLEDYLTALSQFSLGRR